MTMIAMVREEPPILSERVAACYKDVVALEQDRDELQQIRATLLVNFGKDSKLAPGFEVENTGTTLSMMVRVLEHLVKPANTPMGKKP